MDINQIILAIVTAVPATVIGLLAYKRSLKVDAVAEQSGVATESRAGTAQVIEGLNDLIKNLQENGKVSREDIKSLREQVTALYSEVDELKKEVARLHKKYGENGTENK